MHRTALKTVLALMLSAGLAACVTDDGSINSEERAYDPDPLPDQSQDQNNVNPTDVTENPPDVPGRVFAPVTGATHVPTQNLATSDMNLVRGDQVTNTNTIDTTASTQDVQLKRGAADVTHTTGSDIGETCQGQSVDCRIAAPQTRTR